MDRHVHDVQDGGPPRRTMSAQSAVKATARSEFMAGVSLPPSTARGGRRPAAAPLLAGGPRSPGQLSNGQRQRVALGRVLVRPARAFLLDEPLSHLDAKLRQRMRAELKALGAVRRTTTLYVTHDSVEALALGDRIGVIRDGRIVQSGTREDIWYRPRDTEVARAFGRPRINLLPGVVTGAGEFRSADGALTLPLPVRAAAGTEVLVGVRPRDVSLTGDGHPITGTVYVTEVLGRSVEVTVRIGGLGLSFVAAPGEAAGLRPDDPVRAAVRPADLLVFEADRPGCPGRRLGDG